MFTEARNQKATGVNDTAKAQTSRVGVDADVRLRRDRDWRAYPVGTKAHAINGGHWVRVKTGWKWCTGATFPTPGGDAIGVCIEMPNSTT